MEVVGAIASFIAIGQALTAVPSIIDAVKSLPAAKNELMDLSNEFNTLRVTHAKVSLLLEEISQHLTRSSAKTSHEPIILDSFLLRKAETDLLSLVSELQNLFDASQSGKDDIGNPKPKRLRWFRNRNKLPKIHEKVRDSHRSLQTAMGMISLQNDFNHTKVLLEIRDTFSATFAPVEKDVEVVQDDSSHPTVDTSQNADSQSAEQSMTLLGKVGRDPGIDDGMLQIPASLPGRCLGACNCQCHRSRTQSNTPMWLKPVLGTIFLSYNTIPLFCPTRCDVSGCGRSNARIEFNYYLPSWLWRRYLAITLDFDSLIGPGASIELPRIIPVSNWRFWYNIWEGNVHGIKLDLQNGMVFRPNDRTEFGLSILHYAIRRKEYESLELLLNIWETALRRNGVPIDITSLARQRLEERNQNPRQDDGGVKILERIVELGEEQDEVGQSELHDAALRSDIVKLQEVLGRDPDAINSLNHHGEAPIHIAAKRGHSNVICILIKNRVDIDRLALQQETPLHLAVEQGHVDCVRLLLDAGCAVDLPDVDGSLPIHVACRFENPDQLDIVKALITRKPSLATAADDQAFTPLHVLAIYQFNGDIFGELLAVFIDAGADLEAVNDAECTPVLFAARCNNLEGMKCLVAAGARVDKINHNNWNILHATAECSGFRMTDYLCTLDLSTLHDFHLVVGGDGDTPWDCWRYCMTCDDIWMDGIRRRPSKRDARAFVRLFRKVRDQSLQRDIDTLASVLGPLRDKSTEAAMARLAPLVQRKELRGLDQQAETFRAVGIQIQQGMWEAALESVEENLDVYREEMERSPWETQLKWDKWPDRIDYSDARQYHGKESEEYPGEDTDDSPTESEYDSSSDPNSDDDSETGSERGEESGT